MSRKAKILIVEDSFIVAYHLQTTLETEGYKVINTQDSGEGALNYLERNKADLVLMDIMLAGQLDGIETARLIRSRYNIPIIYITALTDKDTIQRAKITEPYAFLTKPFEDREIFTVIEMALYKHEIELKLRKSEEIYFSTLRSISDVVIIINHHYKISYLNPSAEKILGWSQSAANGKLIFDVLLLQDATAGGLKVNPLQCMLGGTHKNSIPENLVLISRDGGASDVGEGSMSAVIDSKGEFAGLVLIFKDITDKVKHEGLLKNFEKERLAALLEGQEKERSRIAKDLHDGLGQMLTAIKMNVNMAVPDPLKAQSLYTLIDDAIQESIRISENLLPSKLRDFDLTTCIKSLCKEINETTNTHISFTALGDAFEIDHTKKINFYRIAQEAINNSIKHAHASNISVQLAEVEEVITLTIEDDGLGIAATENTTSKHHGLVNMRERAEIMGGKLTIESDANRGTLIIAEAPHSKVLSHA